jgi:hypothetical protein
VKNQNNIEIDISKYPFQIQLIYQFFRAYYPIDDNVKNDLHIQSINQLPIELQEDIISRTPTKIHLINHHTLNMWQILLSKDLKWFKYLNKEKCQRYNCYNDIIELYKFLKI